MTQRPVHFNQDMVRAAITCLKCGKQSRAFPCEHCGSTEFVKQQTRRPMSEKFIEKMRIAAELGEISYFMDNGFLHENDNSYLKDFGKLGQPDDYLWTREPAKLRSIRTDEDRVHASLKIGLLESEQGQFLYTADNQLTRYIEYPKRLKPIKLGNCVPNGCFKELASIWHKITGVRAERVRDISEADAIKEGVRPEDMSSGHIIAFANIWNSCYPGSWERNDWVFVYDIQRCGRPE